MIGDSVKILIGGQEGKPMPATCRCNEKIDRAGIDAFRAAQGSQASRIDIGLSIQFKQRVRIEKGQ